MRDNDPLRSAQERLFWAVYRFDKAISFRLGRPSTIRDSEITLPFGPDEQPRPTRLARLQGKVYDQLFSPVGLSRLDHERTYMAEALAEELRGLINETHAEISVCFHCPSSGPPDLTDKQSQGSTVQPGDSESDPMGVIYLQFDLVCQSSMLTLILRAIATAPGSQSGISDDCLAVARVALDMHEQSMRSVYSCKSNPFMVAKYISW